MCQDVSRRVTVCDTWCYFVGASSLGRQEGGQTPSVTESGEGSLSCRDSRGRDFPHFSCHRDARRRQGSQGGYEGAGKMLTYIFLDDDFL